MDTKESKDLTGEQLRASKEASMTEAQGMMTMMMEVFEKLEWVRTWAE